MSGYASASAVFGGITSFQDGCLTGFAYSADEPTLRRRLKATIDGTEVVLSTGYDPQLFGIGGVPESCGFLIPLSPVDAPTVHDVRIADEQTGAILYSNRLNNVPIVHPNGNRASLIAKLQSEPLCKLQYMQFQGDILTLYGFAQSPIGREIDREAIRVVCPVAGEIKVQPHKLTPDGHDEVFWYLPGAPYFGLAVDIDLAEIDLPEDGIEVRVQYGDTPPDYVAGLGNTTWWPCDRHAFGPYPSVSRLERVQAREDRQSVALSGHSDARRIEKLFEHYAGDLRGKAVLDWGCGHGRVIRHLTAGGGNACHGADIDADNIAWAQANLRGVRFERSGLMPPLPYSDDSFDLVYGISVMTHLMPDIQQAWLIELRRVLRKGGCCILTFAGDASVAFSSNFLSPDWIARYLRQQWNWASYDNFTGTSEEGYYRNVHQKMECVLELCGKYFDVQAVHPRVFGYQDVAILRA